MCIQMHSVCTLSLTNDLPIFGHSREIPWQKCEIALHLSPFFTLKGQSNTATWVMAGSHWYYISEKTFQNYSLTQLFFGKYHFYILTSILTGETAVLSGLGVLLELLSTGVHWWPHTFSCIFGLLQTDPSTKFCNITTHTKYYDNQISLQKY